MNLKNKGLFWLLEYMFDTPAVIACYIFSFAVGFFFPGNLRGVEELYLVNFIVSIILLSILLRKYTNIYERKEMGFYLNKGLTIGELSFLFILSIMIIITPLTLSIFFNNGINLQITLFYSFLTFVIFYAISGFILAFFIKRALIITFFYFLLLFLPLLMMSYMGFVSQKAPLFYLINILSPFNITNVSTPANLFGYTEGTLSLTIVLIMVYALVTKIYRRSDIL